MDYLKLSKRLFQIDHNRSKEELMQIIEQQIRKRIDQDLSHDPEISSLLKRLAYREIDPYTTAETIMKKLFRA